MALSTENEKPTEQPNEVPTEGEGIPSDIQLPAETPPETPVPEVEESAPKKAKKLSVLEAQEKAAIIFLARRELDAPGMADFKNLFPALFEE